MGIILFATEVNHFETE